MAKLIFTNLAVAAAFEPLTDDDVPVITKSYSGRLSNINEAAAAEMIADKSGYIKAKKIKAPETPAANS